MNQKASLPFMLITSYLLGACAMQTYEAKPIAPEKSAVQWRERSLQSPELEAYIAAQRATNQDTEQSVTQNSLPIKSWGLPELTLAAVFFHPDISLARAQWRAAQASKMTAGQRPNPTISTSAEHHNKHQGVSPWTMSLGIDIPVDSLGDLFGRREARLQQATAFTEAARLDIAKTAWQVRSRLRSKLLDLYAGHQQSAQLQREVDIRTQIVALLETRLAAGMAAGTDLSDARLQLQKTRTALSAETAHLAENTAALAAAIGLPESALASTALSFASLQQDSELPALEVQRAALLNRLELRKALASYDAAEAKLKLEIAKQYPDFSLTPGYSWDQGDNRWAMGLSLALALLNKNEGPIAEAKALREVEAKQFNALQASIIGEQEQALTRCQAAQKEIGRAQQLLNAQQARLEQTQRQFDSGYADRLELLSAQLELVSTETAVLAARLKNQRAVGLLEDAVQQPLDGSAPLQEPTQDAEK